MGYRTTDKDTRIIELENEVIYHRGQYNKSKELNTNLVAKIDLMKARIDELKHVESDLAKANEQLRLLERAIDIVPYIDEYETQEIKISNLELTQLQYEEWLFYTRFNLAYAIAEAESEVQ